MDKNKREILRCLGNNLVDKISRQSTYISPTDLNVFISQLRQFMGSSLYDSEKCSQEMLFVLKEVAIANPINLLDDPKGFCASIGTTIKKQNIFYLNSHGHDVSGKYDETYRLDLFSDLGSHATDLNAICFAVRGYSLRVCASNGVHCGEFVNINEYQASASLTTSFSEPVENYKLVLERFYKQQIIKEKTVSYWKPGRKSNKFLLQNAPEKIFTKALYNYFNQKLLGIVETEVPLNGGRDKVDVQVRTYDDTYIFEVKWLGTSESLNGNKMTHGVFRANMGLRQTHRYVSESNSPEKTFGVLVLFDARKQKEPITYFRDILLTNHKNVQDPQTLNLEDSTASEEADKETKSMS